MVEKKQNWRIIDVLNWAKEYLKNKGAESPQIEVEWILREVLDCSRMDLYLDHEKPLSNAELSKIRKYLKQRASGKPIQYVLGYTEFYGLRFNVDPSVLIPRPETELIVENLVKELSDNKDLKILDIGTGSGNIIITLMHELGNATGVGIDISQDALKRAKQNSRMHQVQDRIDFKAMDILNDYPDEKFDIIVSNPPYISEEKYEELPPHIKDHEPEYALKPESDPLIYYKRINEIASQILKDEAMLALEIGGTYQEKAVKNIFENKFSTIEIIKDYLGQSRGLLIN
ncbi:MAG: peptide chain release factor N(5)-glutamine methyltransferase [Candidatus Marinimicrobia bacterium]|nr:peptide chain release factor N(5)-glutamine methyltransferase [Candidatus Neomarinimicrobiota bacterium]